MVDLNPSSTAFLRNLDKKLEGIKRGGGGSDVFDIETPSRDLEPMLGERRSGFGPGRREALAVAAPRRVRGPALRKTILGKFNKN